MNVAIELNSDELSIDLINKIKGLFKNQIIKIIITNDLETTEYLLKNEANYLHLINSIKESKTIDFTIDNFIDYSKSLIA